MSSDFLEYVDVDECGSTVLLTMRASGFAWLTVVGAENSNDYCLTPDEVGWKNAEKIAAALSEWVAHTRRLKGIDAGD